MSSPKPVLVLVPGAWHGPEHYGPLIEHLHSAGYETEAVALPSVGGECENWDPDVAAIRAAISRAVDRGRDVVLVAHSYGGMPSQEACKGLDKASLEKQGKKGGIIRLVWLAAFLGDEGASLMGYLGGKDLPWFRRDEGDTLKVYATNAKEICYNDLPAAEAERWTSHLTHHAYQTMFSQTTYPAWKHIPATYLLCENDNAIPVAMQEQLVNGVGQGRWETERCRCGHSPFLSEPKFTSEVIRRAAGEVV